MAAPVPTVRLRSLSDRPLRAQGRYVLYWMIAARRTRASFALQHARDLARALDKPLLVLEPLRIDYPHASARLHRFVIEGMADNHAAFARAGVRYAAYVEPEKGAARGLVEALAQDACAVVTDDFPAFFLRPMIEASAERLRAPLIAVDGNGFLPLQRASRAWPTARGFRGHLHRHAAEAFASRAEPDPLDGARLRPLDALPEALVTRWPALSAAQLEAPDALVRALPVDARVAPVAQRGGARAAHAQLTRFIEQRLSTYADARNDPDSDASSGLSPYLHFGQLGAQEILDALLEHEGVHDALERLSRTRPGPVAREQLLGLSRSAEAFLEQLLVWRELAYNTAAFVRDCAEYSTLPAWARQTLQKHARDARPWLYDRAQLEAAATHDPLWNAAQRQLVQEGRIHNYLRMLWGKKVLEWSATPQAALEQLIWLNDRYALDGRDPNSYAGIAWIFGRYDRAWGPERPIFGTVRYMTSESARRKLELERYLVRYGAR